MTKISREFGCQLRKRDNFDEEMEISFRFYSKGDTEHKTEAKLGTSGETGFGPRESSFLKILIKKAVPTASNFKISCKSNFELKCTANKKF